MHADHAVRRQSSRVNLAPRVASEQFSEQLVSRQGRTAGGDGRRLAAAGGCTIQLTNADGTATSAIAWVKWWRVQGNRAKAGRSLKLR